MPGGEMSQVYNTEVGLIEEIERLAREARDVRGRVEHARTPADRRVLNRQLVEIEERVQVLQARLPG
jgi:hypothetical protein